MNFRYTARNFRNDVSEDRWLCLGYCAGERPSGISMQGALGSSARPEERTPPFNTSSPYEKDHLLNSELS